MVQELYGNRVPATEATQFEHQQFIANDGSNRGLFSEGFREDTSNRKHEYEYHDSKKYDANIIDQAMREVEAEMLKTGTPQEEVYRLSTNNCQHYVDKVLARARKIARETNRPLYVN